MKSFKNVIPLFILNNINGANIEADKITVIDLMTFKEYKTNEKKPINIHLTVNKKEDLVSIIDANLFKTAEGEVLESTKFNNYEIKMFSQENKYPVTFDNSKNLNIYISPSRLITKENILIKVDNTNYKNNGDIRLAYYTKNYVYFKKKEDLLEEDIINLLNHKRIDKPNLITNKITEYTKYFISSLKIGETELKLINNTITKDQLFEIRNAILTNKKIELSLDSLKKVNLEYDTTNLKNNIKTSIEKALINFNSGHLKTAPKYSEIILYVNNFTNYKLIDLVEKGTDISHKLDPKEVDLNKTYTIILDKSCYQKPGEPSENPSENKFHFTFDFKIADNLKDSTEFTDVYFTSDLRDSCKNNDYNTIYNRVINDLKRYNTSITDNDFEILLNNSKIKSTDTFSEDSHFTVVIKNKVEGILKDKVKKDDKEDDETDNTNNNKQNQNDDETDKKNNKKGCSNY